MNLKSIITILLILVCALSCTIVIANAESLPNKVIQEISEDNLIIQIEEKISMSELEKEFPQALEVTLTNGEVETVEVKWKCEMDYANEESDTYVFEAQFPNGYELMDSCASAFVMVVLKEASIPQTYIAWDANPNATKRFDSYLGVTGNVVEWLESHENDDYYLGTPYYGKLDYPQRCTRANGEYKEMGYDSAGMNCTGFVASVMRKLGGDLGKIVEYSSRGKYANAYNWHYTAHNKSIKSYRYTSISKMLASGRLEKGDIIYFEPDWSLDGVDCHMGFFWGDTPDDNKFWHSVKGDGNIISKIKSKSSYEYVYIFKNTPPGNLILKKESGNETITKDNHLYSLENAVFGVYTSYDKTSGVLEGKVGELTTDVAGISNELSLKAGTYYVKEEQAPEGYLLNDEVKSVELKAGKTTNVSFADEPQVRLIDIILEKVDRDSMKPMPSGTGSFENAEFSIAYYKNYYSNEDEVQEVIADKTWILKTDTYGQCKMEKEYKVSGDSYILDGEGNAVLPLGTVVIKETKAPEGYFINEQTFIIQIMPDKNTNTLKVFKSVTIPESKIPETPVIPETGDKSNCIGFVVGILFAGVIIIGALNKKRIVLK